MPIPVASPTQRPNGPTRATTAAVVESSTRSASARTTRSGRLFQKGRRRVDLVDPVGRHHERADVGRRGPECRHEAEDEHDPGVLRPQHRVEHVGDELRRPRRAELPERLEQRVDRVRREPHHAEQRDDDDEPGQHREHRVVGQGGGELGELVREQSGRHDDHLAPRVRGRPRLFANPSSRGPSAQAYRTEERPRAGRPARFVRAAPEYIPRRSYASGGRVPRHATHRTREHQCRAEAPTWRCQSSPAC